MQSRTNVLIGVGAGGALLALYFGVVSLISGAEFAVNQFEQFWYYIVPLAVGFGVQVGLYLYLRAIMKVHAATLAVSGGTSTVAMLACCAHYLANIAPLLATAGIVTFIAQYQVQFFWIGLAFNIGGIAYIVRKINNHNDTMNKKIDVVCGMEVNSEETKHTSEYKGETYYFCSVSCKDHFVNDPEKYVG